MISACFGALSAPTTQMQWTSGAKLSNGLGACCGWEECCRVIPDDSRLGPPFVSRVVLFGCGQVLPSRRQLRLGFWWVRVWHRDLQAVRFGRNVSLAPRARGLSMGVVKSRAKTRHTSQLLQCSNGVGKAMIFNLLWCASCGTAILLMMTTLQLSIALRKNQETVLLEPCQTWSSTRTNFFTPGLCHIIQNAVSILALMP